MAIRKSSTKPRKTSGAAASKPRAARAQATTDGSKSGSRRADAATSGLRANNRAENTMNRILLVDLGERELKERQKLRARRQVLKTILETAENSGGLNAQQLAELATINAKLSSDITVDDFYRTVVSAYTQSEWEVLADENSAPGGTGTTYVHKYGLIGSQRVPPNLLDALEGAEREIAGICGLLQLDGQTEPVRNGQVTRGFVQKVSSAQGEYRECRELFDAAFNQLSGRYTVPLKSQIKAGLIDRQIYG